MSFVLKHGDIIPIADGDKLQIDGLEITRYGDTVNGPIYSEIKDETHRLHDSECVYYTKFRKNAVLMIGSSHPMENLRASEHFIPDITIDRLERYIREQSENERLTTHFNGSMYYVLNHANFRMFPMDNGVKILVYTDFVRPGHHHWDVCNMIEDDFIDYIYQREQDYMARRRVFASTLFRNFVKETRTMRVLHLLNHKFYEGFVNYLDGGLSTELIETLRDEL